MAVLCECVCGGGGVCMCLCGGGGGVFIVWGCLLGVGGYLVDVGLGVRVCVRASVCVFRMQCTSSCMLGVYSVACVPLVVHSFTPSFKLFSSGSIDTMKQIW